MAQEAEIGKPFDTPHYKVGLRNERTTYGAAHKNIFSIEVVPPLSKIDAITTEVLGIGDKTIPVAFKNLPHSSVAELEYVSQHSQSDVQGMVEGSMSRFLSPTGLIEVRFV